MSTTVLKTTIKLRKDTAENYNKVASTLVPLDGEVCIVDTKDTGLRLKVGNGVSNYSALPFIDNDNTFKQSVIVGRYNEGKFYTNPNLTGEVTLYKHQIYIDYLTSYIYYYSGTELVCSTFAIPTASSTNAGILKLYETHGANTDGTITQKFFTDSIEAIALAIDSEISECLTLAKP